MITFNVKPLQRFFLFICFTVVGLLIAGVISQLVLGAEITATRLNIVTVVQDVALFIFPAILTAMIITRQPARFLQIDAKVNWFGVMLVVLILICSIPMMNLVIEWNKGLRLPESLASLEMWFRQSEDAADAMLKSMMGGGTVMNLIVNILTVGVMAGLAEELFFRGGIQRLMITAHVNRHVAVWLTAILFSVIHFQFYGFVPRMLLGAFFGYLCVWSGSLWYSVIAHCTNNIFACVSMWIAERSGVESDIETMGTDMSSLYGVWHLLLSMMFTIMFMANLYRYFSSQREKNS